MNDNKSHFKISYFVVVIFVQPPQQNNGPRMGIFLGIELKTF